MSLPSNLLLTTQVDLGLLVADHVREGPHLEFKRQLPFAWNDAAKHEFLADATSFANAGGGDLIFGISENGDGQAESIVPLALSNVDQEIRRIQDFLLNLAEPRMPGVQVHAVEVSVAGITGHIVVVRIPQSWVGPHRVKTNQHFFIRDGLRKRQLDIPEIRSLFLRSESQTQRILDFRTNRLGKLLSGEAPHRLVDGPILAAHILPTQAALGLVQIDPVIYATQRQLPVIGAAAGMARLNVDGALAVRNENQQGLTHGYSQLFRNGFLEATYVLSGGGDHERVILPSQRYEEHLIAFLRNFRAELSQLGINAECVLMLSLLRADEVRLGVGRGEWDFLDDYQTLFDRKTIVIPDVLARADISPERALKPVFDLMWQAAGFYRSRNYNDAGEWAPQR